MKGILAAMLLILPAWAQAELLVKCDNGIEFKAEKIGMARADDTYFMKDTMIVEVRMADGQVRQAPDLMPMNVLCYVTSGDKK